MQNFEETPILSAWFGLILGWKWKDFVVVLRFGWTGGSWMKYF